MIGNKPIGEPKVDDIPVNGLLGTPESLAYIVNELERHNHNVERWMAAAAVPVGETHVADQISDNQTAFQADGGNDTWGAWIQILGSDDTPIRPGQVKFDFRRILVIGHEHNTNPYLIQFGFGASGAAALSAGTYTEITEVTGGGNTEVGPVEVMSIRQDNETKVWARVWAVGKNTGTLDFLVGIHEYDG